MNRRSTLSWAVVPLLLLSAAGAVIGQGPGAAPPPPNLPAEFNTQTGQRIKVHAGGRRPVPSLEPGASPMRARSWSASATGACG